MNSALSLALGLAPINTANNIPSSAIAQTAFAFYQARSLTTLTEGQTVTNFPDLSPNARNLSINSGTPIFRSAGYVELDGVDDCFENTSFNLNGLTDVTLCMCTAYRGNNYSAINDGPFFINEIGNWGIVCAGAMINSVQWRFGSGLVNNNQSYTYSGNNPGTGTFATFTIIRSTNTGNVIERLWINGTLVDTKNLGNTNLTLANNASTLFVGKGLANIYTPHNIRGFAIYPYNAESIRADIETALS